MNLGELNTLINNNVYENTERAITGGSLQKVLQGMMGAFFGTSTLSGLGPIVSQDMRDAIGSTLGSNGSLISQLANNLATNSTFGSNLANNSTFNSKLASSLASVLAPELATNSTFGRNLVYNSSFTEGLATNYTFTYKLGSMLASSSNFQVNLGCKYNYYDGSIAHDLVYNSSFISGLKSQLGL